MTERAAPLSKQLIVRPDGADFPRGAMLAEYDARHRHHVAADRAHLPPEELELADSLRSDHRRIGFLAGRIALRAAFAAFDAALVAGPVLRDARGRPNAAWDGAPRLSIAHTRVRAVAAVAPPATCAAIGVDVEEIDAHRAHALVRMSLSSDEVSRVQAVDAELIAGPIALWCAREACVKAHALEVGWFGTALVATSVGRCDAPVADATRAWTFEIAFESRPAMRACAWESRGAIYAFATRAATGDAGAAFRS